MTYRLSKASEKNLEGVHPKLVAVVRRAIQITKVDFKVIEGVRSKERMWENWGKGRTAAQCRAAGVPEKYAQPGLAKVTWLANPLNSNHRVMADGYGHAVDLLPAPYDWTEGPKWKLMADAMIAAGKELGTPVRWGRDWNRNGIPGEKGETDGPHFELV